VTPQYIRGYVDPLSTRPGETVRAMVSTTAHRLDCSVVRLRHADARPGAPGLRVEPAAITAPATLVGREQAVSRGSTLYVEASPVLARATLTLLVWAWPTRPDRGESQPVAGLGRPDDPGGFVLLLTPDGLELRVGGETLALPGSLEAERWHRLGCALDLRAGTAIVGRLTPDRWPRPGNSAAASGRFPPQLNGCAGPLMFAGAVGEPATYDGKLAAPLLLAAALPSEGLIAPALPDAAVVAAWDFSTDPGSTRVVDSGPHGLSGTVRHMPARGVTDHLWDGSRIGPSGSGPGYGAIHFHADDVEDAGWDPDLELQVPGDLRSGVYAVDLAAGDERELLPFVVVPPAGQPGADVAVLLPTFTYLAYGNERDILEPGLERYAWVGRVHRDVAAIDPMLHLDLGPSLYDRHRDGSGCRYASRLRPLSVLRPAELYPLSGAPRNLAADLYLVDWLDHEAVAHDVLTDDALHAEGAALLRPYRVLVTGGHPEYFSAPMLDALESYLAGGGRLMYLGGNGCYWVTGVHRERPHVIEVRRSVGWRPDAGQLPGEGFLATTGEPGGLWHDRGRPPHRLLGVGFAAEGRGGPAAGYVRCPDSRDPRAAFIFEGVPDHGVIGEFGLVEGGVAGDEVDRLDVRLGSPSHALLLATSSGRHGDHVRLFDPLLLDEPAQLGTPAGGRNPSVRADMVFYEGSAGGAVFSVGSIAWCGGLSHQGYDNDVARITGNVLRRFRDPAPFPYRL
jgi:N,N-dimethylformamidase